MKAHLIFHRKDRVWTVFDSDEAVLEISFFEVPKSGRYPEGLKYSLFLVLRETGRVLVGFDNHFPKGPHVHLRTEEYGYRFVDIQTLMRDFQRAARLEGYVV